MQFHNSNEALQMYRVFRSSRTGFCHLAFAAGLGLALGGCGDETPLPTGEQAISVSLAGAPVVADLTPRAQRPLAVILAGLVDSTESDGTLIVGLKEPAAVRGVSVTGVQLPIAARYAAQAAIVRAFPQTRLVAGVEHPFTYTQARGLSRDVVTDTLHRTYIRLVVPHDTVFLAALRANPYVDFIEPNYWKTELNSEAPSGSILFTVAAASSASEARPWGIDSVRANQAWALGWTGTRVGLRVVDTGIDWETDGDLSLHPDIAADSGIMFYSATSHFSDNRCRNDWEPCYYEDEFHGTGVFGAAAAEQNGVGSIGIAPGDWWLAVAKALYVTTSGVRRLTEGPFADAVLVVTDYHNEGHEVGVTSIGFPGDTVGKYQLLHDAFRASTNLGVLWFAAASQTSGVGIPGAFDEVIAIGALNENLTRRLVSPVHPKIELVAPGDGRYSWNRRNDDAAFPYTKVDGGTSYAAPTAAGVARLAWQAYPTWSVATMRAELRQHARDLGPAGRDNEYGYGMPDALCLINQYAPCKPTRVGMTGPDYIGTEGSYTWTAQPSGGTGSYTYRWEYRPEGSGTWSLVGQSQSYSRFVYSGHPSFDLRITVTSGQESPSTTKLVFVDITPDPPPCVPTPPEIICPG